MRPTFQEIYLQLAEILSKRSTCKRLSVGCVITSEDFQRVLAVGYNGNAAGLDNTCDREEPGNCGDLHAEENAVIKCRDGGKKIVFVTHAPCIMCAKRLINLGGVVRVYYRNSYRSTDGLEILKKGGISNYQLL